MQNFLSTIVLFGKELDWTLESALFWLLIVQVVLIMFMVIVFAVLIKRVGHNRVTVDTRPTERVLQGISLDLDMVKRNFEVGEEFNCDGLIISANYNLDPVSEPITEFAVITQEQLDILQKDGPVDGCFIIVPDMNAEGKVAVSVNYRGKQAAYVIGIGVEEAQPIAAVVETPAAVEERALTSLELDLGVVQREFTEGEEFNCDGLVITAGYNLDPKEEIITEYTVLDKEAYDSVPAEELSGCYVIKPDTSAAGKIAVTVRYQDKSAVYMVVVNEHVEELEPLADMPEEIIEDEPVVVAPARKMVGLSLDLSLVQREFTQGDEFNCDGLIINANYDADPLTESVVNYVIVDELPTVEEEQTEQVAEQAAEATVEQTAEVTAEQTEEVTAEQTEEQAAEVTADQVVEQTEQVAAEQAAVEETAEVAAEQTAEEGAEVAAETAEESAESAETQQTEQVEQVKPVKRLEGCFVVKPDLSKTGKQIVAVYYNGLTSYYSIAVAEPKEEEKPERVLQYITVNTDNVQKDFVEGDPFTCEGIVVTAHFNLEPLEAEIENFSIVAPDMNRQGSPNVSVQYQDRTVGYRINIAARPVEEVEELPVVIAPIIEEQPQQVVSHDPIVIEEESYEAGVLRYDKSFTARYIQASDEIKSWYTTLKNALLSYKKVKSRISWKRETYRFGRETVARLGFRGNTLCIFLPLNPADYEDTKYKVEDVSDSPSYVDTPCMYRLKNERRIRLAIELFDTVMERLGGVHIERESMDYYVPYEGVVELINKGLVKRVIKKRENEAIFLRDSGENVNIAEGSAEQTDMAENDATVSEEVYEDAAAEQEVVEQETAEEQAVVEQTVEEQAVEQTVEQTVETEQEVATEEAAEEAATEESAEQAAEDEQVAEETAVEETQEAATEEAEQEATAETVDEAAAEQTAEATEEQANEAEQVVEEQAVEQSVEEQATEQVVEQTVEAEQEAATEDAAAEEAVTEESAEQAAEDEQVAEEAAVEETQEAAAEETEQEATAEAVEETAEEQETAEQSEEAATEETVASEDAAEQQADAAEQAQASENNDEQQAEAQAEEVAVEYDKEIEDLSNSERYDVEHYKPQGDDEGGIDVVGAMFRRRGRKVYWFDPAGKDWEKGEIALYVSEGNPTQEVIVVDRAKRDESKLHLPLKPLYKRPAKAAQHAADEAKQDDNGKKKPRWRR